MNIFVTSIIALACIISSTIFSCEGSIRNLRSAVVVNTQPDITLQFNKQEIATLHDETDEMTQTYYATGVLRIPYDLYNIVVFAAKDKSHQLYIVQMKEKINGNQLSTAEVRFPQIGAKLIFDALVTAYQP